MKRKIILIGGAPTAGKSVLARKLSKELTVPWMSTDAVRHMMRQLVSAKDFPHIFYFKKFTPVQYLTKHTAWQVVVHENLESLEVWEGVKAFLSADEAWGSYIIEGIAVLPHLVHRAYVKEKIVRPLFLTTDDPKRIRKIVFTRGLWDDAHKYPDSVKEKEVEWVLEFNRWLKKEAKKYGYPVFDVSEKNKIVKYIAFGKRGL